MRKHLLLLPALAFAAFGLIGLAHAAAPSAGSLIKGSSPSVYYLGTDGKRYVFPTEKTFKSWYADFSGVQTISDSDLATIMIGGNVTYRPGSRMVKVTTDPKVYAVDADGTLRPISDEATAKALYGADWNTQIDDLPDAFFTDYRIGLEIKSTGDFSRQSASAASPSIAKDKMMTGADTAPILITAEGLPTTIDPTAIPLGDGKYSTSPKAGYIYTCQTSFNGSGAQGTTPWIHGSTWDSTAKPKVQGSVDWPTASVKISDDGTTRTIISDALPTDHPTGTYPIASTDPAHQYDGNPNSIKAQSLSISLPASPAVAAQASCIQGEVGIAIDGVPIFDGFDAAGRDAQAHEVQDLCSGHPQEAGEYHHHGGSACVKLGSDDLFGYAYDGFGIYYEKRADGSPITDADLDECHGRTSEVMWDGKMVNMYHYDVTAEFPYTVGCFKGTSSLHGPTASGGQGGGQQGGQMPPPPNGGGMLPPPPRY